MRLILTTFILSSTAFLANAEQSVERGEYLVRGPAGCGNCHTPQTPEGVLSDECEPVSVFQQPQSVRLRRGRATRPEQRHGCA